MPKERLVPIGSRVPVELHDRVTDFANRSGQTVSEFVRMALDEATRSQPEKRMLDHLPREVIDRLMHALLFTEASFESFLSQQNGLAEKLKEEATRRLEEVLAGAAPSGL